MSDELYQEFVGDLQEVTKCLVHFAAMWVPRQSHILAMSKTQKAEVELEMAKIGLALAKLQDATP